MSRLKFRLALIVCPFFAVLPLSAQQHKPASGTSIVRLAPASVDELSAEAWPTIAANQGVSGAIQALGWTGCRNPCFDTCPNVESISFAECNLTHPLTYPCSSSLVNYCLRQNDPVDGHTTACATCSMSSW